MSRAVNVDDERITTFGLLLEAHTALISTLDDELGEQGAVSLQWLEVLLRIARTPGGCLPAGVLGRSVSLTSGATTRLIDRMEAAGLVARRSSPDDRRVVLVELTDDGRAALAEALPLHLDGLQRHVVEPLSTGELRQLDGLMRKLRDHVAGRFA